MIGMFFGELDKLEFFENTFKMGTNFLISSDFLAGTTKIKK